MEKKIRNKLALLMIILCLTSCTNAPKATEVLTNQGYKDVKITGWNYMSCSKDDFFSTGFSAMAPGGKYVTGTVCTGLLKGSTIRFD
jgi:hypothetical protein